MTDVDYNNTLDSSFTFAELQENSVSSQNSLSWSASIELVHSNMIWENRLRRSWFLILQKNQ
jgi:hypothetical protein